MNDGAFEKTMGNVRKIKMLNLLQQKEKETL